ncbi:MAG: hypothetical protein IJW03_02735 [Clostridia bacterium]|nr:hypothetical protein [Clostridia bacterium]
MKTKNLKYTPALAGKMYAFFANYSDAQSAPSFEKFARSIGATKGRLEGFKKHAKFALAWEECEQILRDYLIDRALTKRFDPTFVKYMLTSDTDDGTTNDLCVRIVVED